MCRTGTEAGWSEDAGDSIEAGRDQGAGARQCTGDLRGPPTRSEVHCVPASAACETCWGSFEAWAVPGEAGCQKSEAQGSEASSRGQET